MSLLIAGNESPLFNALAAEAARHGEPFAAALIPPGEHSPENAAGGVNLEWNPASPLSARTLILEARNRMKGLDRAMLVCVPPACRGLPEAFAPAALDRYADNNIKGWFFLLKELCAWFKSRASGSIALIVPAAPEFAEAGAAPDLAGYAAVSAFRALAQGLLVASIHSPYEVTGFTSDTGENEAFAAHVFKILAEKGKRGAGKWHKFAKFSLFRN
ncbi:MAG: hypothetical protein LBN92_03850 [Treponema sp.]|jgi:NAD(P)-dependent dehydrogenase (short-subunit alcohol dehydrogenase family)|nr:hypothetical protein [Treponema sp.]